MNNEMQVLAQIIQLVQMGNNPKHFMINALNNNPKAKAMFQMAQKSGNMEQFVRQYAQQNNIDIQPMIDMFSGNPTKK